jgi:PrgI family protein
MPRIPADIDLEDRILGRLTARQLVTLAATATVLYVVWTVARPFVPAWVFLAGAAPVAAGAIVLAVGRRGGLPLDRYLIEALRYYMRTRRARHEDHRRQVPGWLAANAALQPVGPGGRVRHPRGHVHLPPEAVHPSGSGPAGAAVGVVDLGAHGRAVIAACSTVPFGLRTAAEQDGLIAVWARYLHALGAAVHVLVRAVPLELGDQVAGLRTAADQLPHPALAAACLDHADYLHDLATSHDLLRRQVLLVLREPAPASARPRRLLGRRARRPNRPRSRPGNRRPGPSRSPNNAADARLARRLAEAADLLAPAGIIVTPLDPDRAAAVLASATNPGGQLPITHLAPQRGDHWDDGWDDSGNDNGCGGWDDGRPESEPDVGPRSPGDTPYGDGGRQCDDDWYADGRGRRADSPNVLTSDGGMWNDDGHADSAAAAAHGWWSR